VLDTVSLIDLTRGDLLTAGTLPGQLRSNDAIHLVVALRIGADEMLTYDAELAHAAAVAGLPVARAGLITGNVTPCVARTGDGPSPPPG